MKRSVSLVVAVGAVGRTAPADTRAASLSEFFKPGVVFQDRNGDGAIDFVDARIVLPRAAVVRRARGGQPTSPRASGTRRRR